jgi:hypothetical protein
LPPWKRRKGGESEESILKNADKTPKMDNPSVNNPVAKVPVPVHTFSSEPQRFFGLILGMHQILFLPDILPAGYPANP